MIIENSEAKTAVRHLDELQSVLYRYCLFLTKSNVDAEDLAQDTWVKAFGSFHGLEHTNPQALLMRIAKNNWIDQMRRRAVFARIHSEEHLKFTMPDHGLFEIELVFQAIIKHLSPVQRVVFLLRDVFEYANAEVAHMLDMTEGAVKAALYRSRQSLSIVREELEKSELSLPEEEHLRAYLRTLAFAYQKGNISLLVEMLRLGEMEPVLAISNIQNRMLRDSQSLRPVYSQQMTRMAA
ncbi:sigma-70 family RNA polymerase sigma factor [Paenibacillus sediminis]|uniref:RNA polymerase sigma-70 factor (ECF subfamily) n=1 Tax=Paenibacillus sediminis TaxID=664909 RepID=A0ABS4H0N3_9BACL|nr:sigma-70 family RNA polymerase sigma factor [Paenibacillus sediminis]MBP1936088.1 RNA polymerase sigma-70 factor (ECF subfamily) [Paenibacillus sediminis]